MTVHHAVGISRQRNSGYRPSRVNIMAQGLSTPDPSFSPTHLSIRRGRATSTHYTHRQVSLVVSRNIKPVPSLWLRIGPACEVGLSAGMRRERVPPQIRKKETNKERPPWALTQAERRRRYTDWWSRAFCSLFQFCKTLLNKTSQVRILHRFRWKLYCSCVLSPEWNYAKNSLALFFVVTVYLWIGLYG